MKKLNKSQKEKIKKGILTGLHVLGYICIGITLLMSIIVGVNSCKPKEVKATELPNNQLVRRAIDTSNYSYNDLYNINPNGTININKGDIYYFNPNSLINVGGGTDIVFNKVVDCQVFNSSSSAGVRFNAIALWSASCVFALNGSGVATQNYHNASDTFVIFVDACTASIGSDYYKLLSFFNNILVKVDNYTGYLDVQTDITGLFNLNYYVNLVQEQWVNAGSKFLYPFVLNLNELENHFNQYYFAPLYISNTYYYQFLFYPDQLHLLDFYTLPSGDYTSYLLFLGLSSFENQVLGYCPSSSHIFTIYCGCYKWSNLYNNFLNFCYPIESSITDSDISNGYSVSLNLNYQFSGYYLYRDAEQNGSTDINDSILKLFDSAIIRYNGSQYDGFGIGYWAANWHERYYIGSNFNQPFENGLEPLFIGQLLYARYYQVYRSLSNSDSRFVKLLGIYDPNFYIGSDTGSSGSSTTTGLSGIFVLFGDAFTSISNVLNIQLFGAFTLGSLIFIPLVVTIVLFIVKMFKR